MLKFLKMFYILQSNFIFIIDFLNFFLVFEFRYVVYIYKIFFVFKWVVWNLDYMWDVGDGVSWKFCDFESRFQLNRLLEED